MSSEILIAGGGIAGLACALALAGTGRASRVFERSETPQTQGAGLQISPNGYRVLDRLGLGEKLRTVSLRPEAVRAFDARSGRHLTDIPFEQSDAAQFLVLHRADLLKVLFDAAVESPLVSIEGGCRVERIGADGDRASLVCTRDQKEAVFEGDGIIAADGVRSKIRAQLTGRDPVFSGKTAWRALMPLVDAPAWVRKDRTTIVMGNSAHFVLYPLGYRDELNLVFITDGQSETFPLSAFDTWATPFRRLLSSVRKWTGWPLYGVPAPHVFANGRVAFAGDASHAMLPFLAQGAVMALEDAAVLADAQSNEDGIQKAGIAYEKARRARVRMVADRSHQNGRIYHMNGPAALARNMTMSFAPGRILAGRYDSVYDWTPPEF